TRSPLASRQDGSPLASIQPQRASTTRATAALSDGWASRIASTRPLWPGFRRAAARSQRSAGSTTSPTLVLFGHSIYRVRRFPPPGYVFAVGGRPAGRRGSGSADRTGAACSSEAFGAVLAMTA